jgi:hypothetical protein
MTEFSADPDEAPKGTQTAGIDALPALHRKPNRGIPNAICQAVGIKAKDLTRGGQKLCVRVAIGLFGPKAAFVMWRYRLVQGLHPEDDLLDVLSGGLEAVASDRTQVPGARGGRLEPHNLSPTVRR